MDPILFSSVWYSSRLNQPRLRYIIGFCIQNGRLVRSGSMQNSSFINYSWSLETSLETSQNVLAESGYPDDMALTPYSEGLDKTFPIRVRSVKDFVGDRT